MAAVKLRHSVAGTAAVVGLVLVGLVLNVVGFTVGQQATIDELSVAVTLNDEIARDIEDVEGGSTRCVGVGPPPDVSAVWLEGTVTDHTQSRFSSGRRYAIRVEIGTERTVRTLELLEGTSQRLDGLVTLDDDDSVDPGETAAVHVALRRGDSTVDSVTRHVHVTGTNTTCVDSSD